MNIPGLLALALAPGVAIGLYIYLKDKHEREPLGLLFVSFLYGAASTVATLVISIPVNALILTKDGDVIDEFYNAFFKVALIEEFCKFAFVRFILYYNRNFNEPFDGIVYAVMVSMGFATVENILYVFEYGFATGMARMFTAVPAHATFGVLMGYFVGRAKFSHRDGFMLSLFGLLTATVFHGSYDYFWFIASAKDHWAGTGVGAIASLLAGFLLSRKAIRLHQQASPFIVTDHGADPEEPGTDDRDSSAPGD